MNGPRHEHLTGSRRADAGTDVDGQASDIHRVMFELAGVDAGTNGDAGTLGLAADVSAHRTAALGPSNTLRVPSPVTVIRSPTIALHREPNLTFVVGRGCR